MDNCPTKTRFLNDTKDHVITILRDDGVYRHIKVAKQGTYCYSFEIITWHGWLCYTGDMGSYTFQRLTDMFEFFRPSRSTGDDLCVNPSYWAEKVQAADKNGGILEFSADLFRRRLEEDISERDREDEAELMAALREEVLHSFDDGDEREARELAENFRFKEQQVFHDLWDYDFKSYTHHFLWCCYAIAWTVREYDKQTAARAS